MARRRDDHALWELLDGAPHRGRPPRRVTSPFRAAVNIATLLDPSVDPAWPQFGVGDFVMCTLTPGR